MGNISYLPGAERAGQINQLELFAAAAVEAGWKIDRRSLSYVIATRSDETRVEQVSVTVINGVLRTSRTEVRDGDDAGAKAIEWLGVE